MDLTRATAELFEQQLGTGFEVRPADTTQLLVLKLTGVERMPALPKAPRAKPFSLYFMGPGQPVLEQRTYPLQHKDLGVLEIFLVPIGYQDGGMLYEAVFN